SNLIDFSVSLYYFICFLFRMTIVMIIFDLITNNDYFTSLFIKDPDQGRVIRQVLGVLEDILKIFAEGIFIVGIYKCWKLVSKK
ncbi:MAG: hypothetical protein ACRC8K_19250, partial [Waterburya sp.]